MNDLLEELSLFTLDTDKQQLQAWAQQAEAQIDRMPQKEGAFYYLILSEFHAVRLRDIETGYELLKRIGVKMAAISDEVKVRRCFYKYLEGAYEFALEDLDEIVNSSKTLSSRKIAIDFFRRIFQRDKLAGHSKLASKLKNIESYEQDFLKALKFQSSKSFKLARETHRAIFTKYGKLDQSIEYQESKNIIRLMQNQGLKIERDEYQEYQNIIRKFQQRLENKNYYEMKLEFIFKVLEFINPEKEDEEILIDFQMAKKCVMENLEQAIKKNKDKDILATLKETLRSLQEDEKEGEQICYKFLGDKGYNKLLLREKNEKKSKVGRSRFKKQYQDEQEVQEKPSRSVSQSKKPRNRMKSTHSKLINKRDDSFQGSLMTKINFNSGGFEERYFYIKEDFHTTLKLYYCPKKDKPRSSDDFYSLKGIKSLTFGKESEALQRKECDQFTEDHCFTLKVVSDEKYQRNFYVKNKQDFDNWTAVFEELIDRVKMNQSKLKKTRVVVS